MDFTEALGIAVNAIDAAAMAGAFGDESKEDRDMIRQAQAVLAQANVAMRQQAAAKQADDKAEKPKAPKKAAKRNKKGAAARGKGK